MLDRYKRRINYLRVSVTDRCNLRCQYCMPAEGVVPLSHNDILSYDEILVVVKEAVALGVDKIRITGGEPLVRKGILTLVEMIAGVDGVKDLSMTSNAILLDRYASDLKSAGLQRINISLDTLDPEKYAIITRGGNIKKVFDGIRAADEAGLLPIKLNCVVTHSSDEPDAQAVRDYAQRHGYEARFIHLMDLENGYFEPVEGGAGGNCAICNRIRLSSNGMIMPCLFSTRGYSVRELGAKEALVSAIKNKPARGGKNPESHFYEIGG